jgi:hypothetical protein
MPDRPIFVCTHRDKPNSLSPLIDRFHLWRRGYLCDGLAGTGGLRDDAAARASAFLRTWCCFAADLSCRPTWCWHHGAVFWHTRECGLWGIVDACIGSCTCTYSQRPPNAGDLVTLPWWTQLWLNEGFATYFEKIGAGFYWNDAASGHPPPGALNYMRDFHIDALNVALDFDSQDSSYALAQADMTVTSEGQAEALFDRVVYEKGASVLRMLHAFLLHHLGGSAAAPAKERVAQWQLRRLLELEPAPAPGHARRPPIAKAAAQAAALPPGPEVQDSLFAALLMYLKANQFASGGTDALWAALTIATGAPVTTYMQRWTHQQGVPVVSVSKEQGRLVVKQQQLRRGGPAPLQCGVPLATPVPLPGVGSPSALGSSLKLEDIEAELGAPASANATADARLPWWLPVQWVSGGGGASNRTADGLELVDCKESALWPDGAEFVKLNAGEFGVYRCAHHRLRQARSCRPHRRRPQAGSWQRRHIPPAA